MIPLQRAMLIFRHLLRNLESPQINLTLHRIETELGLTPRPESPDAGRPMTPVSERGMHE